MPRKKIAPPPPPVKARTAVTPLTKGAATRRPPTFAAHIPKATNNFDDESTLYTGGGNSYGESKRIGRTAAQEELAAARMQGSGKGRPSPRRDDPDPEELGEVEAFDTGDDDGNDESDQVWDVAATQAADGPIYEGINDVAAMEDEIERRVRERLAQPHTPPVSASANVVSLEGVVVSPHDIDRLWDWLRQDRSDTGARFFGKIPATAMALYSTFTTLANAEVQGVAMIRALYYGGGSGLTPQPPTHVGFVMVAPIMSSERVALVHLFIAEGYRSGDWIPAAVGIAAALVPGYHLAMIPTSKAQATALSQQGFTAQTLFVR